MLFLRSSIAVFPSDCFHRPFDWSMRPACPSTGNYLVHMCKNQAWINLFLVVATSWKNKNVELDLNNGGFNSTIYGNSLYPLLKCIWKSFGKCSKKMKQEANTPSQQHEELQQARGKQPACLMIRLWKTWFKLWPHPQLYNFMALVVQSAKPAFLVVVSTFSSTGEREAQRSNCISTVRAPSKSPSQIPKTNLDIKESSAGDCSKGPSQRASPM